MRFDAQKAFPYPVLRPYSDDYRNVDFQTTVDLIADKKKIQLNISYALSCDEIQKQIYAGKAEYVSVISCRDTYYRSLCKSTKKKTQIEIDIGEFRGEVRVDPYIFVRKNINKFYSPHVNDEFGQEFFKFKVGDILAQDEPQVFYVERDLFKPVSSVIDLVMNENIPFGEWALSVDQQHVQILVSKEMKEIIDDARNTTQNKMILLNSLWFAAVMQGLQRLKDSHDFDQYKWAEVFRHQTHNKGINIELHDSYYIAQQLLGQPLKLYKKVFEEEPQ